MTWTEKEMLLVRLLKEVRGELFGIDPEDRTTAERNIWRHVTDVLAALNKIHSGWQSSLEETNE